MPIVYSRPAVRLYYEQFDMPPGSSQVIPSRAEFDAGHETVVLRQGGKALARVMTQQPLSIRRHWTTPNPLRRA